MSLRLAPLRLSCFRLAGRMASVLAGSALLGAACGDGRKDDGPKKEGPPAEVEWNPQFKPDVNTLTVKPGVEPATETETMMATVTPTSIEFPMADASSVRSWSPGRVVVGGIGSKQNPLGYARRVLSVDEKDGKLVVQTEPVAFDELFAGEVRYRGDTSGEDMDLTGLDPAWIEAKLYPPVDYPLPTLEPLPDDPSTSARSVGQPGGGFVCCGASPASPVGAALALKKVLEANLGLPNMSDIPHLQAELAREGNVGFKASVKLDDEVKIPRFDRDIFRDWEFKKMLPKNIPAEIFIKGTMTARGELKVNPGFSVAIGASVDGLDAQWSWKPWEIVSVKKNAYIRADVDTRVTAMFGIKAQFEAGIRGADLGTGWLMNAELEKALDKGSAAAQTVLNQAKEDIFGNKDNKPEGTIKLPLWRSQPRQKTFFAGPVPVVVTATVQLDLICNFEAKASIEADLEVNASTRFKFSTAMNPLQRDFQATKPEVTANWSKNVQVLGGGSLVLGCDISPRVNILVYDGLGAYAGVRAGLEASGKFSSKCHPTRTRPSGEVELAFAARAGLYVGGRAQVPATSALGKAGIELGYDSPMLDIFNEKWPLLKNTWQIDKGLGYCTPLCSNRKLDDEESGGKETDVDCGGGDCATCATGKACVRDLDCGRGLTCVKGSCQEPSCDDGVKSGDEGGVDCGGTCTRKCALESPCNDASDCESGACRAEVPIKVLGLTIGTWPRVCVANACEDGMVSPGETGIDCGGQCRKCKIDEYSAVPEGCETNFSDGTRCVYHPCFDRTRNGDETGPDCGGSLCYNRCGVGVTCNSTSDCQGTYECKDGVCKPVPPAPQPTCDDRLKNQAETDIDCGGPTCSKCAERKSCGAPSDCASGVCMDQKDGALSLRLCAALACDDLVKNGGETDVDCGGSACPKCAAGRSCMAAADCVTGVCLGPGSCAGDYLVGGSATGVTGSLVLRNGVDMLTISADGAFAFPTRLVTGAMYAVHVVSAPVGFTCMVANGSGTMGSADVTNIAVTCMRDAYRVGGTATGVTAPVTLTNNGGDSLVVSGDGSFMFATAVPHGSPYAVTVEAPPSLTCMVANGSGTIGTAHVSNVSVTCTPNAYRVGGTISGVTAPVTLQNNGGDDLAISGDGAFNFATSVVSGGGYAVTAVSAALTCMVSNGSGTISAADVTNVSISCSPNTYTIGGTISALVGTVVLQNNLGDDLTRMTNGAFTFTTRVAHGSPYHVTVMTQPAGQNCRVIDGIGTATGTVTGVLVQCAATSLPSPNFLWLDASDADTITKDGSNNVAQWRDRSGLARHANVGAHVAPVWSAAAGPSGRAAIQFNGDDVVLSTAAVPTSPQMTMFIVYRMATPQTWGSIINQSHDTYFSVRKADCCGANGNLNFHIVNNNEDPQLPLNLGAWQLVTVIQDATTTSMYYSQAAISSTAQAPIAAGSAAINIGNSALFSQSMGGAIAEIRGYTSALDLSERTAIENDLRTKWNLDDPRWIGRIGEGTASYAQAESMAADIEGNLYVLTSFEGTALDFGDGPVATHGLRDCAVVSYNRFGAFRWRAHLGGTAAEGCTKLAVSPTGDVLVAGWTYSTTLNFDATTAAPSAFGVSWVASYTGAGALRWGKVLASGEARGVSTDPVGNVFVGGQQNAPFDYGTGTLMARGDKDLFLVSYDAAGTIRWARVYGADGLGATAADLSTDAAGNLYTIGELRGSNGNLGGAMLPHVGASSAVVVASHTNLGVHRWSRSFPGANGADYFGRAIRPDGMGNVFFASTLRDNTDFGGGVVTHPAPGQTASALVKLSATDGTWVAQRTFLTGGIVPMGLGFDASLNVFISGNVGDGADLGGGAVSSGAFFASYTPALAYRSAQVAAGASNSTAVSLAFGPAGEMYLAGRITGGINWGSGLLTAAHLSDGWISRIH